MKLIALAAALAVSGTAVAQTAPATQDSTTVTTTTTTEAAPDPQGGYQPTQPLFTGTPKPGDTVVFVPNTQTPDQAYPAPPPMAHYPICKPGQFDNCRQRGG
ncbi:hypothetical protein [Sphingomonas sp.]|uniref:hypothetical protein n=1 Tax=Sphingomonas sp. TaxID=28214 RepID=UPI001B13B831|nr:hypothetical protein [Sphingomonas sp.]MBO9712677.1 hypothetical protein [Sphingomonas sp.]